MADFRYSFVIPTYNDSKGISAHFSYFFSRKERIQLVIVDDFSSDDTEFVIKKSQPPENITITYVRQPNNLGSAVARNTGIPLTDADFVMFLDADDLLTDYFFNYIELSPLINGADLVLFKYHLTPDISDRYTYAMHQIDNKFFSSIGRSGFPLGTFNIIDLPSALSIVNFPWNKMYRRDFLIEQSIQFPDHRMHEDIMPHWHSLLRAKKFGVLAWAPPLITHVESRLGTRATNYVGPQRLTVFQTLRDLYSEITYREDCDSIVKELEVFFENLSYWLTNVLCAGTDVEKVAWRAHYDREIKAFRNFLTNGSASDSADSTKKNS